MIGFSDTAPNASFPDFGNQPDIASNISFDGREISVDHNGLHRRASMMSQLSRASADSIELPDEIIRAEGLRHCESALNAKRYKGKAFMDKLFDILQELQVPTWSERVYPSNASISSTSTYAWDVSAPPKEKVWIHKVSGSLTNAVFFLTVVAGTPEEEKAKENPMFQSIPPYRTLLLRIYGPHSSSLINRVSELRILHVLSSRYRIGPRVYGTFANGRIEEYFESRPLTALEMRDSQVSKWIAIRMSELHRVDLRKVVDPVEWADPGDGTRGELGVKRCMRNWLPPAREVLELVRDEKYKQELDIELFAKQWDTYYKWVRDWEKENDCEKESPRVFCHNDTQYGNLLRLTQTKPGALPHQQIIVVDFEYAGPNSAAFDIANQFCEWTSNYLGDNPAVMNPSQYPTRAERNNFYLSYLQSGVFLEGNSASITNGKATTPHSIAMTPANPPPVDKESDTDGPSTPTESNTPTDPPTPTDTQNASGPNITTTPHQFTDSPAASPSISRQNSGNYFSKPLSMTPLTTGTTPKTPPLTQFSRVRQNSSVLPESMELLEGQVSRWMPASHGIWGIWGIVQGKENVIRDNERMDQGKKSLDEDGEEEETEFDYLLYAKERIRIFRDACHAMGVF